MQRTDARKSENFDSDTMTTEMTVHDVNAFFTCLKDRKQ